jgi:hypothetical protein
MEKVLVTDHELNMIDGLYATLAALLSTASLEALSHIHQIVREELERRG